MIRLVMFDLWVDYNLHTVDSIHSGTTSGEVKMNFGRAERLRYRKYFVPMYGQFLQKCYSTFIFD